VKPHPSNNDQLVEDDGEQCDSYLSHIGHHKVTAGDRLRIQAAAQDGSNVAIDDVLVDEPLAAALARVSLETNWVARGLSNSDNAFA
jgi:hypothetical protein